jgi:hypothetical protein
MATLQNVIDKLDERTGEVPERTALLEHFADVSGLNLTSIDMTTTLNADVSDLITAFETAGAPPELKAFIEKARGAIIDS